MGINRNFKFVNQVVTLSELVSVECTCDVCGKSVLLEGEEYQITFGLEEFGPTVEVYSAYGSPYDGMTLAKTFCWSCFMGGVNKPTIIKSCDGVTSWEEYDEPYQFGDDDEESEFCD